MMPNTADIAAQAGVRVPHSSLSDFLERRFISRSIASRMNSAIRFGPTNASIASRTSVVRRTSVGLVSDFLFNGGRPIRGWLSDIGKSVNFFLHEEIKRYRLLTLYPISVISSITNGLETAQMTNMICISGYDQPDNCEHCGKRLIHGVRTNTHGVIGADCFVKLIKADRKRFSGNGKPSPSMVRDYAKMVEFRSPKRLSEMGYSPHHFQFEAA